MKRLAALLVLLFLVGSVGAVTESYVSQYPPANNGTYVNASDTETSPSVHFPWYATDASLSLTGSHHNTSWMAHASNLQRFSVDLGAAHLINRIYYENMHDSGTGTNVGIKNFTFWGSNSSESFSELSYDNDTGWVQITTNDNQLKEHVEADTADPQYINLTSTVLYRYYSLKGVNNWGTPTGLGFRRIELQSSVSWEYTTPGSYTWTCPEDVVEVITQNVGGGGGGYDPVPTGYNYWYGLGGHEGEYQTFSGIDVVPGENYTIVVGANGAANFAGSPSSAFGHSVAGGAAGTQGDMVVHVGGDGDTGYIDSIRYAINGTGYDGYAGGLGGLGRGAGGGGAGVNYGGGGSAGAGAGGYLMIYNAGAGVDFNLPDFSATPLIGVAGTLVQFTDLSTINDATNLTYLWDFGDGDTSSAVGDISHVFAYVGSYTISLSISSDDGTVEEVKEAYINLIAAELRMNTYSPRSVAFTILDINSVPVVGATVNASIDSSTFPNGYQDLIDFFGMTESAAISALNTVSVMEGITDSTGGIVFTMLSSAKYTINITSNATVYSQTIYPSDLTYTIRITSSGYDAPFTGVNATDYASTTRLTFSEPNMSFITMGLDYRDMSGATDYLQFFIETTANSTVIYSYEQAVTGTERIVINRTYPNVRAQQFRWYYDAHREV